MRVMRWRAETNQAPLVVSAKPDPAVVEISGIAVALRSGLEVEVSGVGSLRSEFVALDTGVILEGGSEVDVGVPGAGVGDVSVLGVVGEFGGIAGDEVVLGG
jgi:hypothetical protein